MGTFSFLVLLLGFAAVLYWYFINEHYKDDNGSSGFLGVITNLDDAQKYMLKNLFSLRTSKLLYKKNEKNDEALKRKKNKGAEPDNQDDSYKNQSAPEDNKNIGDEKTENQDHEKEKKRNVSSRFYRYTDTGLREKYKAIPRLKRKAEQNQSQKKINKRKQKIL